jgi:Raf kinase inhibitor-like YbhB/YbcL family protein
MHFRSSGFFAIILCFFLVASGCTSPAPQPVDSLSQSPQGVANPSLTLPVSSGSPGHLALHIGSLEPGSPLPDLYTCKGSSDSPPVSWEGIPAGAKSLALIVDDPDAPSGKFTHWIVFNIPPSPGGLEFAQPNVKVLSNGAQQGYTSAGTRGYYPPCPPVGSTHRYVFWLYAVDMDIIQPTADRESIDWALTGHTIAKTSVVTTFKR